MIGKYSAAKWAIMIRCMPDGSTNVSYDGDTLTRGQLCDLLHGAYRHVHDELMFDFLQEAVRREIERDLDNKK